MLVITRFLGSSVAEYISEFVESGQENREIISNVFNYDRWKDKDIKSENELFLTKEEIINSLCSLFRNVYIDFMSNVDLKDMFRTKRRQFFQLKRLLEKLNAVSEGTFSSSYIEKMNAILKSLVFINNAYTSLYPSNPLSYTMHGSHSCTILYLLLFSAILSSRLFVLTGASKYF